MAYKKVFLGQNEQEVRVFVNVKNEVTILIDEKFAVGIDLETAKEFLDELRSCIHEIEFEQREIDINQ